MTLRRFLFALVVVLAIPATARAATTATVVEREGARLDASAKGTQVCVAVVERDEDPAYAGEDCAKVPRHDLLGPFYLSFGEDQGVVPRPEVTGPLFVGGAVRSQVYAVEFVFSGRRTVRVATEPAPASFAGSRAGGLRFFLAELPREQIRAHRLYAADGTLLEQREDPFETDPSLLRPPIRVATGVAGERWWTISMSLRTRLAPVRGDAGRRERVVCIASAYGNRNGGGGSEGGSCTPSPGDAPTIGVQDGCGARGGHVVYGIARADALPQAIIMGDGTRAPVRPRPVPVSWRIPNAVAFVSEGLPGQAVRSVLMPDGDRIGLEIEPPSLIECARSRTLVWASVFEHGESTPGPDQAIETPGGPPLSVRDDGVDLCLAVGRPTRPGDCLPPHPWLFAHGMDESDDQARAGGWFDPTVAAIRVRLDDRTAYTVPTHAGAGYTGRYAGLVAFFSTAAPPGRRIVSYAALDAAGEKIYALGQRIAHRTTRRAVPLVRRSGLVVSAAPLELVRPQESCFFLTRGTLPRAGADCVRGAPFREEAEGFVSCTLRAGVVFVRLTRHERGAVAVIRDGTRTPVRVRRAPAGERMAIVVLRPHAALRAIEIHDRHGFVARRHRVPLPPASEQCGYDFSVDDD